MLRGRVGPGDGEFWLARRLGNPRLFAVGATDSAQRREILRAEIVRRGFEDRYCGRVAGKEFTFAEAFERLYGEPLKRTKETHDHETTANCAQDESGE